MDRLSSLRTAPRIRHLLAATALAASLCWTSVAETSGLESARALGKSFAAVARSAYPAVVFIKTEKLVGAGMLGPEARSGRHGPGRVDPFDLFSDEFFERFFRHRQPRQQRRVQGQGSGFLVSKDGYVLTNNHVVTGADRILVKLADGRELVAKLVGADPPSDVGVLKLDVDEELPFLPLGTSEDLEVGEWVLAVGNPFGLSHTMTAGIISALGRDRVGITDYEDFIQTDAAINPGNSGGPLLNLDGEVVGINTAIFSRSGGYMGIGFSIPIDMARSIYDQLRETGTVRRGFLGVGIQELTKDLASSFGMDEPAGVLIASVDGGSAAAKAGLEAGDVILKLDGKDVEDMSSFRNQIALKKPGSRIRLVVLRDGKREVVWAKLQERGGAASEGAGDPSVLEELGFTVKPLDPGTARKHQISPEAGVEVATVEPGTPAARAGIRPGAIVLEVARESFRGVEGFLKAIEKARPTGSVLLRIREGSMTSFVVLPFGK